MMPSIPEKVLALLPRLASDADGEVVATARRIGRQLKAAGTDWHDLVSRLKTQPVQPAFTYEPPAHRSGITELHAMAVWLAHNATQRLSPNARSFVMSMTLTLGRRRPITERQEQYLHDLFEKNGGVL